MAAKGMKIRSIRIPQHQWDRIKRAAERFEIPPASYIRQAIVERLERDKVAREET